MNQTQLEANTYDTAVKHGKTRETYSEFFFF